MIGSLVKWVVLFAMAAILQTTVVPQMAVGGVFPDTVLILLFILAMDSGRMAGIWAGFFAGLMMDVYAESGTSLGIQALAKTIIGGLVGFFEQAKMDTGPIVQVILLILASLIHDVILFLPLTSVEGIGALFEYFIAQALPRSLYTALLSSFLLFTRHYMRAHRKR